MARVVKLFLLAIVLSAVTPSTGFAGDGQTLGPFCIRVTRGTLVDLYEVFIHLGASSNLLSMKGTVKQFGNNPANGALIGSGHVENGSAVLGWETFPTDSFPIAAKLGAVLLLSGFTGNGSGYHLTPANIFFFTFVLALLLTPCPVL